MARQKQNLHSIHVLLFLNVVFFFLQYTDRARYAELFAFDRSRVMAGELWRLVTYQFSASAWSLFFNLLILYIMGAALEELWGTFDFLVFFFASAVGSAAVAFAIDVPLFGASFLAYALLFAYARVYPEVVFLIFFVLPVKVKWLALLALGWLALSVILRRPDAIAIAGGAICGLAYIYFRHQRVRVPRAVRNLTGAPPAAEAGLADRNLARYAAVRRALSAESVDEQNELARAIERDIVKGVNICPPADFKPENEDRYCARCEGFAECSVRYLRAEQQRAAKRKLEPGAAAPDSI